MFQLKKVFVQFLPKNYNLFFKKKISNFFLQYFKLIDRTCFHARTILSTTDKMADVFCGFKYFFSSFHTKKKNKICNSCFLAKTKREGNEIVVHSVSFISNTANSQPVSDLRFSIVVACDRCYISKKSL